MLRIKPVGFKVLVEPIDKKEELTEKGIIIPGTANAELAYGVVIQSPDRYKDTYKPGDFILYNSKSGISIPHNNKPHLILDGATANSQGDIYAIVEEGV